MDGALPSCLSVYNMYLSIHLRGLQRLTCAEMVHSNWKHTFLQYSLSMTASDCAYLYTQGPMREAMESDVVEEDGEVVVRMSTGNWFFLREDPDNRKAFILEGGFGDRYRLQTDKPVQLPASQLACQAERPLYDL